MGRKAAPPASGDGEDARVGAWGHQAWLGGCCPGQLGGFGCLGMRVRAPPWSQLGIEDAGALAGLSPDQAQHSTGRQEPGQSLSPARLLMQPRSQIQPKLTPIQLHLSRGQPEPSQPPGRGHNTEWSCDAMWGRRTSTGGERPAPRPPAPMSSPRGRCSEQRDPMCQGGGHHPPGGKATTTTGAKQC